MTRGVRAGPPGVMAGGVEAPADVGGRVALAAAVCVGASEAESVVCAGKVELAGPEHAATIARIPASVSDFIDLAKKEGRRSPTGDPDCCRSPV